MRSLLAERLKLKYEPVGVVLTNEKPEGAAEFQEGKWGCCAALLKTAAAGRPAVFSRKTFGCLGGGVGIGFGNMYPHFPGGIEHFLSTGREGFREGEAYKKTPELAQTFVDGLPMLDVPTEYVAYIRLSDMPEGVTPEVVVFFANADQLSALVVMANYGRAGSENVTIPFAAGCQSTFLLPYAERLKENPRAVVGMTDISARPVIDADLLSFSVPLKMFDEMEGNIEGSFFDKHAWERVDKRL